MYNIGSHLRVIYLSAINPKNYENSHGIALLSIPAFYSHNPRTHPHPLSHPSACSDASSRHGRSSAVENVLHSRPTSDSLIRNLRPY